MTTKKSSGHQWARDTVVQPRSDGFRNRDTDGKDASARGQRTRTEGAAGLCPEVQALWTWTFSRTEVEEDPSCVTERKSCISCFLCLRAVLTHQPIGWCLCLSVLTVFCPCSPSWIAAWSLDTFLHTWVTTSVLTKHQGAWVSIQEKRNGLRAH